MGILLHAYIHPSRRRSKYGLCYVCNKVRFWLICLGYRGSLASIWQHRKFPHHLHHLLPSWFNHQISLMSPIFVADQIYLWGEILCEILSVDICGRCFWFEVQCFVSNFNRQTYFEPWSLAMCLTVSCIEPITVLQIQNTSLTNVLYFGASLANFSLFVSGIGTR